MPSLTALTLDSSTFVASFTMAGVVAVATTPRTQACTSKLQDTLTAFRSLLAE